jgi:hypothetical protein
LAHAASHAAGTKASFFGTVSGMTGNVWIIADNAGAAGNSIELSFDGVDNIDTVLGAWNSANPSNTAAFAGYGGDAAQVPDNGETITLSGGAAAGSDALPYDSTPRFDSLNVGGGEINNWVTNGEHIAQFVAADGTSVKPFTGIGGSANFELFQDSLLSSGFSHGLCIPGQPPDGIYRLTLYNGSSWNPKIIVPQTGTIGIEENLSLRDRDNEFAATFDVQNQLSDDVTLTIPDQSGTIARGQTCRNGLFLWIAFLHHFFDVRRYRFFGATFFEGHNYSPFILVVYFLPRQVNCLAPEVRAALNA